MLQYLVILYLFTAEDSFPDVFREVETLQDNYYQFGKLFGLPSQDLDDIQKDFHQNNLRALTEVLLAWLKHHYKHEDYGPPTWRKLVETVDNPAGGSNHKLAKHIANDHPKGN